MTRTHIWQEKYYAQLNGATIEACAVEPDPTGCGCRPRCPTPQIWKREQPPR